MPYHRAMDQSSRVWSSRITEEELATDIPPVICSCGEEMKYLGSFIEAGHGWSTFSCKCGETTTVGSLDPRSPV